MMKKVTKRSEDTFSLVQGELPVHTKEQYDWETKQKFGFEPWHLATLVLIIDVCILCMYFFVNTFVQFQLPIGYGSLAFNFICLITSFILVKKKQWSLGTLRFSKLINTVALCITIVVLIMTIIIDSLA